MPAGSLPDKHNKRFGQRLHFQQRTTRRRIRNPAVLPESFMRIPAGGRFRRVHAPSYCRPAGLFPLLRYEATDMGICGIRVLSDERHNIGEHLDIELLLPSRMFLSLKAQVVWVAPHAQAKWEVGLRLVAAGPQEVALLECILEEEEANTKT